MCVGVCVWGGGFGCVGVCVCVGVCGCGCVCVFVQQRDILFMACAWILYEFLLLPVVRPGESKFREEWLQDILDSKSVILNSIQL